MACISCRVHKHCDLSIAINLWSKLPQHNIFLSLYIAWNFFVDLRQEMGSKLNENWAKQSATNHVSHVYVVINASGISYVHTSAFVAYYTTVFSPCQLSVTVYEISPVWCYVDGLPVNPMDIRGSFCWYGSTSILAWINNNEPHKVWNEITYPFPNFNGCTSEVWEWIRNSTSYFKMDVITYPNFRITLEWSSHNLAIDTLASCRWFQTPRCSCGVAAIVIEQKWTNWRI